MTAMEMQSPHGETCAAAASQVPPETESPGASVPTSEMPRLLTANALANVLGDSKVCACGNTFLPDSAFCQKCGAKRPKEFARQVSPESACSNKSKVSFAEPLEVHSPSASGNAGAASSIHSLTSPNTNDRLKADFMSRREEKRTMNLKSAITMTQRLEGIQQSFRAPSFWVRVTGATLAVCAGIVNSVSFLTFDTFVSHVTGTTTKIAMQVEGAYKHDIWYQPLVLLLAFLFGSVMCGLLVVSNEVHFGKSSYGLALLANSALLIGATFFPEHDAAPYLAATACGLQNGMCTMHFGAVVRTTHVTGLVTDLGLTVGRLWAVLVKNGCRCLRLSIVDREQIDVDFLKLQVLTILGVAFFAGCMAGAYLNTWMGAYAFLVPASITGVGGFICVFFRQRIKETLKSIGKTRENEARVEMQRILQNATAKLEDLKAKQAEECINQDQMGDIIQCMDSVEASIEHLREEMRLSPKCRSADSAV